MASQATVRVQVRHLFMKHTYSCRLEFGIHTQYHHISYHIVTANQLTVLKQHGAVKVYPCTCNTHLHYGAGYTIDTPIQVHSQIAEVRPRLPQETQQSPQLRQIPWIDATSPPLQLTPELHEARRRAALLDDVDIAENFIFGPRSRATGRNTSNYLGL